MTKTSLTRRSLVAGASLVAVPALAASPAPSPATPIAKLWAEAQTLKTRLIAHRGMIAEAALRAGDGLPGWMRLGGEANTIAEARYQRLVQILKAPPQNAGDLAIIAKVAKDDDISAGARGWASERLASAALAIAA